MVNSNKMKSVKDQYKILLLSTTTKHQETSYIQFGAI